MRHRIGLLAVAAIVLAACGGDDDDAGSEVHLDTTPATTAAPVTAAPVTTVPETAAQETAAPEATPAPTEAPADEGAEQLFPDVLAVEAAFDDGSGTWRFDVTLSSPYDTPQRYADAWRVMGPDGTVFGTRELLHDHANEQPFTRSLSGVEIPDEVTSVTVEGRDQVSGYGGDRVTIELVRS